MKPISVEEVREIRNFRDAIPDKEQVIILLWNGNFYLIEEGDDYKRKWIKCTDCTKAHVRGCPQYGVADKHIEDYSFLHVAYEIISARPLNCKLVIVSCNNYSQEKRNTNNASSKVQAFVHSYYGVNNKEELEQELKNLRINA